jgi:hypothetical protein
MLVIGTMINLLALYFVTSASEVKRVFSAGFSAGLAASDFGTSDMIMLWISGKVTKATVQDGTECSFSMVAYSGDVAAVFHC